MAELRRLGMSVTPNAHVHLVVLDDTGNGTTSEDAFHHHVVVGGVVQPSPMDGHSHSLPSEFVEVAAGTAVNPAVRLHALASPVALREAKVSKG